MQDGRYVLDVLVPGTIVVQVRNGKIEEVSRQILETSNMYLDSGQSTDEVLVYAELENSDVEWPGWDWS